MNQIKLNTKEELVSAISTHKELIRSFGVKSIGIFGSFSKGHQHESSDVDLLVDFRPGQKTFDNFIDLSYFLEELFGRKVELLTPQSLSKFIGPYILKEVENVSIES